MVKCFFCFLILICHLIRSCSFRVPGEISAWRGDWWHGRCLCQWRSGEMFQQVWLQAEKIVRIFLDYGHTMPWLIVSLCFWGWMNPMEFGPHQTHYVVDTFFRKGSTNHHTSGLWTSKIERGAFWGYFCRHQGTICLCTWKLGNGSTKINPRGIHRTTIQRVGQKQPKLS